ncbi:ImcF-related family protein [Granulicella tundricola]|uniref:ImcF domain protein n=1 Tax=Granulicella tundricola (strain ATCC BAA-1859 / DSM 23138 / MP5ACTX9) TaxID=1198114 RepID=E8X5S3_GRATM|nr:ImcF-related family protein [Granulicella tundricola]ADW70807.1 ImcF domain protein [Granulicella tundricola MP5ACTX9]
MKRIWLVVLGFVLYLALVIGVGFLLHLPTQRTVLFIVILGLLGAAACAVIIWYLNKISPAGEPANAADQSNLDSLIKDADNKLKQANRPGIKSLAQLPLIYVIGDENSAKTQTILQSGLDPELLAGQVYRDQSIVPTQSINIWLTGSAAVVEASGALLRQPGLWQRLVKLTAPGKVSAALSKSALQPTRAVVLCVSIERILAPSTSEQIRALAQSMNERLRQISQSLGISLPVYVLFTKLDTVTAFAEYAANLTEAEVTTPLGSMLAETGAAGAGLYADRAAQQIGQRFDEVAYLLSEFRLELLARGGQPQTLARSYEFPRDLRKIRPGIVDFLVEVARPTQIGVNPYLRGFFFSGMRAHIVEDVLSVGAQHSAPIVDPNAGATKIFSIAAMQQQAAPTPVRSSSTRKVAQWVFLPYFFSRLVLTDKTALESSRSSTRVSGVKRFLAACVCALFAVYLVLLTISFFNNRSLENRAAAATRDIHPVGKSDVASVADLQSLEELRQVLVELDGYHKDGAPLMDRWGIYRGEDIHIAACHAWGDRFNKLLLTQTQNNITTKLAALPVKALPTDEYQATYKPLKAWLITTSNPDKSTTDFLPPVLFSEWVAARSVTAETGALAENQFEYYAGVLPEPNSCLARLGGKPDQTLIANTRGYLNSFAGMDHVYLSMKAAADRKFQPIEFKKLYPGSVRIVSAPTIVDGSFSKDGFTFMQDAINHPDQYLSGEEWVTGPVTAPIDRGHLRDQLSERYQTDFLGAWRTFIKTSQVNGFGGLEDAANRLHELDGPASPVLQVLGLVSRNTSVSIPAFSQPFQMPQAIVKTDTAPTNSGYTEKLTAIEQALRQMISAPGTPDPSGVNSAAGTAETAVNGMRGSFDPAGVVDTSAERLLREPITYVGGIAGKAGGKAANKEGGDFCAAAKTVLDKFPFNPDAKLDATPEEVATFFSPTGPIGVFVASQSKFIAYNGTLYSAVPGTQVNPALLNFLNATKSVAAILLPNGATTPSLNFSITQEATPSLTAATLDVDGTSYSTVGTSSHITWQYRVQGSVKLAGSGQTKNSFGPWSIFHFAYAAKHPAPNKLEYIFQNNGITEKSQTGVDIIYNFDLDENGAKLLNPDYMRHSMHCVSTVTK